MQRSAGDMPTCVSHGYHFGMCRRVQVFPHPVQTGTHRPVMHDNQAGERCASSIYRLISGCDCLLEPFLIVFFHCGRGCIKISNPKPDSLQGPATSAF